MTKTNKFDALPKSLTLNVTAKHIKSGVREDANHCPIARAFKDATGIRTGVEVTDAFCTVTTKAGAQRCYALTDRAGNFVTRFDEEGRSAVKPFKTTIKLDSYTGLRSGFRPEPITAVPPPVDDNMVNLDEDKDLEFI